jgi:hypothetical protein
MKIETQKILLAFEYGVVLSQVAQELNIPLDKNKVEEIEKMIKNEFKKKTCEELARDMNVNILSTFETDSTKNTK